MSEDRSLLPVRRLGSIAAAPVTGLPRLALAALSDLRTVAESVRVLPEVAAHLASIDSKVDALNQEVTRMREAVESVDGRAAQLNDHVAPLEQKMDELRLGLSPLRRIGRRMPGAARRGRAP